MNLPEVGVVIARFQCPELTAGHRALLDYVRSEHPTRFLVLLGVSPAGPTARNPLDYLTREMMVAKEYPTAIILPVNDCRTNDVWSQAVDDVIAGAFGKSSAILYGGRDSFIPYYEGKHLTCEFASGIDITGTETRKEAALIPLDDTSFRKGVIYGVTNQFPRVFPTVDMAMVKVERYDSATKTMVPDLQVLLGRKPTETQFRLPGGFADLADPSMEAAAGRELHEETGMYCEHPVRYVGTYKVHDWRHRWCEDVGVMTHLYTTQYCFGGPTAGDDLEEVKWFPLNADLAAQVVEEHRPLLEAVLTYWTKELHNA